MRMRHSFQIICQTAKIITQANSRCKTAHCSTLDCLIIHLFSVGVWTISKLFKNHLVFGVSHLFSSAKSPSDAFSILCVWQGKFQDPYPELVLFFCGTALDIMSNTSVRTQEWITMHTEKTKIYFCEQIFPTGMQMSSIKIFQNFVNSL